MSLNDLVKGPTWQVLGTAIAAAAIVVRLLVLWWQRRPKKLSAVYHQARVVSVAHGVSDQVRVMFHDQTVEDVSLIDLQIKNTGKAPIEARDFAAPLRIDFGEQAMVLTTDVVSATPPELAAAAEVAMSNGSIVVSPLLMNPGDVLKVKCLVSRSTIFTATARISGVRNVDTESLGESASHSSLNLTTRVVGYLGVAMMLALQIRSSNFSPLAIIQNLMLVSFGHILGWSSQRR